MAVEPLNIAKLTGRSCFEDAVRATMVAKIDKEPHVALALMALIPSCADVPKAVKEAATRGAPVPWASAEGWLGVTYIDAKGEEKKYDSPSALCKVLNISTSGIQCDPEGKSCRSNSQIESIQIHGYTVYGNGEGEAPVKGVTKHITVIHPDHIAKMQKESKKSKGK